MTERARIPPRRTCLRCGQSFSDDGRDHGYCCADCYCCRFDRPQGQRQADPEPPTEGIPPRNVVCLPVDGKLQPPPTFEERLADGFKMLEGEPL